MNEIIIRGARQHNLKNIDLTLPRNKFIVVTGVSGSGKSSLAFDTLFAEGQRRYLETLSSSARQFMQKVDAPDVDEILGLSPAIAIEQKGMARNPRSTVGTMTEVLDFLRLLYSRLGTMHCPDCGIPVVAHSFHEMLLSLREHWPEGARLMILAPSTEPVPPSRLGKFLAGLRKDGFARVRFEGKTYELDPPPVLPRRPKYVLDIVVDRIVLRADKLQRISDSLELAAKRGAGRVAVAEVGGSEKIFSERLTCLSCGREMPPLSVGLLNFNHPDGMCPQCKGLGQLRERGREEVVCPSCTGTRYGPIARSVTFFDLALHEITRTSASDLARWLQALPLSPAQHAVASRPISETLSRITGMRKLGLAYLSMDRATFTLSSGEVQRLRLVQQFGTRLSGVLYVLDEPSIGLHARDHRRLLDFLCQLRDAGNTLVVVEHDRETILRADYVVDVGPGAGEQGGAVLFAGPPQQLSTVPQSLTGQYLSGQRSIPHSTRRVPFSAGELFLKDARGHNLKSLSVRFPLGCITCVTGVSGSGKSSLVLHTLYRALAARLHGAKQTPLPYESLEGSHLVSRVSQVHQGPLGRTPRSTPATHTGIFQIIRHLYSQLPESRARGYGPGRFSFNAKGGRCEHCKGEGILRVEMAFLPDVQITCPSCRGSRYSPVLDGIRFKGASISQVLQMTISQGLHLFENIPALRSKLEILQEVGLGYLRLGQPAPSLSGGEAQRIRLATDLAQQSLDKTVFFLDEPTTGLHFEDIARLLHLLQRLVAQGHTAILIEHQLDVINAADYVIDLGPEGGDGGGELLATGTPEEICRAERSVTGRYLQDLLED